MKPEIDNQTAKPHTNSPKRSGSGAANCSARLTIEYDFKGESLEDCLEQLLGLVREIEHNERHKLDDGTVFMGRSSGCEHLQNRKSWGFKSNE